MMKKILLFLLTVLCSASLYAWRDINYTLPSNWAVYTAAEKADKPFDVFYIYPTLVADKNNPLMQWDEKTKSKVIPFANAQLSGLKEHANLYSPYVRQLEFYRCMKELNGGEKKNDIGESSAAGINDAAKAFHYYLTHLNRGRPYILLGHSQGALDLAMVLIMNGNIMPERGFVAAYLIGIPLKKESAGAKLPFAKGADDFGVVITWNTESPDAAKSPFSGKGTYCINPLNWRTDAVPAAATENPGSMFYDYTTGKITRFTHLCGAVIDPEKGALTVRLPAEPAWLGKSIFGKGIYHMNDLYLFYDAMVNNMRLRVSAWQKVYGK